jgi:hypothetical protein
MRSLPFALLTPLATAVVLAVANPAAAELTAKRSAQGAVVTIDGTPFTEYLVSFRGTPILWPIIGPTGKPLTRAYPMAQEPNEHKYHPHHRSLWFTHGDVNGLSFWDRETIKHRKFLKIASGKQAVIVTLNDWLAPDGTTVCQDERTLTFGADADARWIDFDITVKAADAPVKFGDTKEGTFGIRVADTMRVDAKLGGRIINSEGQTDADAWGKPAAWVDYCGPVDGQTVGIAVLNHPSSFRFPTYWHVRTYGLFAANSFGLRDFTGTDADGSHTLQPGQTMTFRYRVLLHRGDHQAGKVAEAFTAYAKEGK